MDNGGWIKLHRRLLDKPIWSDSTTEQKVILITLLLMANHTEREWEWQGEKYRATAGQFVTSLAKIAEVAGSKISIRNVRTALDRFERYGFLTNQSTNKNRLITIVNWANYQTSDAEGGKQTDRQLTSDRQATDRRPTTNKNERTKKQKNDKILKEYAEFVHMTENEYETLLQKHGKDKTDKFIETLDHYKGATGKKYASDYRAILSWVIDRVETEEQKKRVQGRSNNSKPQTHTKPRMVMDYKDEQSQPMTPEELAELQKMLDKLESDKDKPK